jgi:hypothetical protein
MRLYLLRRIPEGEKLKTNFVLVDFENVQPKNLGVLEGRSFKIKIFSGANQSKVPLEMASALQAFGANAEYVAITGNGRNALDFHIAYYIGRLATENPGASFHVISKDKGFDPLIKHMKAQGISCQRSSSIADINGLKVSGSKLAGNGPEVVRAAGSRSVPEKLDVVVSNLAKRKSAKPRTLKTLRSTINALFGNSLADAELDNLIEQLTKRSIITVADGKVQYQLP